MISKRSQAFIEFLMTYGWMILVVLVLFSGLSYYNIFNPSRFLSKYCDLPPGLTCSDVALKSGSVSFLLQNRLRSDIQDIYVNVTNGGCGYTHELKLERYKDTRITLSCPLVTSEKKDFKGNIVIQYATDKGEDKQVKGRLRGKVE